MALILPNFVKVLHTQFTFHIKVIQSDGGGEFFNHIFKDFFASKDILHKLSCPGIHKWNGLAKRLHWHVVDVRLTLMAHSFVHSKFWTTLSQTLVFLINQLPIPVLHNQYSFELVYGFSPSYTSLHVFGFTCYPYLTSLWQETILDFKSSWCVFLGCSLHHNGYHCMEMHTSWIYVYHHIEFEELSFPFSMQKDSHFTALPLFKAWPLPNGFHNIVEPSPASFPSPNYSSSLPTIPLCVSNASAPSNLPFASILLHLHLLFLTL